jgi:hypothetical protein
MHKIKLFIFLIALFVSINLFAQDKFEKESRIKVKDVPSKALLFIDTLNLNIKVKWYKEEGLDRKSIEAKFKRSKVKYSLEFNSLGAIEDIEIEVNWGKLESILKDAISLQFQQNCMSYRILKVQRQFTGSDNDLFALLKTGNYFNSPKTKYEIIIRCRLQKKVTLFEYLFNDKGILISKSKIIFKNSSHLEY